MQAVTVTEPLTHFVTNAFAMEQMKCFELPAMSFDSEKLCRAIVEWNVENRNTKEFICMMSLACELCDFHHERLCCVWTCSLNEMHFNYMFKTSRLQHSKKILRRFLLSSLYFIRASFIHHRNARACQRTSVYNTQNTSALTLWLGVLHLMRK